MTTNNSIRCALSVDGCSVATIFLVNKHPWSCCWLLFLWHCCTSAMLSNICSFRYISAISY